MQLVARAIPERPQILMNKRFSTTFITVLDTEIHARA
jgi:hypothetical protein